MDRIKIVNGYFISGADYDRLQDGPEGATESIAQALMPDAIAHGMVLDLAAQTVSAGRAYDANGRRIEAASALSVDLDAVTRPTGTDVRWITVWVQYKRVPSGGTVTDANTGITHSLYQDDGAEAGIAAGAAAPTADAARPALTDDQVVVGDVLIDATTAWADVGAPDVSRRRQPLRLATGDARYLQRSLLAASVDVGSDGAAVDVTVDAFEPGSYRWLEVVYRREAQLFTGRMSAAPDSLGYPQPYSRQLILTVKLTSRNTNPSSWYADLVHIDLDASQESHVGRIRTASDEDVLTVRCIASHAGAVYVVSGDGDLYELDPVTAIATLVGDLGVGVASSGMTSHRGDLLWGTSGSDDIYRLNTATGAVITPPYYDDPQSGGALVNILGLASLSDTLWIVDYGWIVRVDESSGTPEVPVAATERIRHPFGTNRVTAITSHFGELLIGSNQGEIYPVDTTSMTIGASLFSASAGIHGMTSHSVQMTQDEPPAGLVVPDDGRLLIWRDTMAPNGELRAKLVGADGAVTIDQIIGIP